MEADQQEEIFSMKLRCAHLVALNAFDALITLYALTHIALASEANPLWASIIAVCPWLFLTLKTAVGTYLIFLLYRCKTTSIRRFGSSLCIAVYWGILIQNSLLVLAVKTDMLL